MTTTGATVWTAADEVEPTVPQSCIYLNATLAPYLADKTGATEAITAINAAMAACNTAGGGVVYLPSGSYLETIGGGGLLVPSNVRLLGEHMDTVNIISNTNVGTMAYIGTSTTGTSVTFGALDNISFLASGTLADRAIYTANAHWPQIKNVVITGPTTGIQVEGGASQFACYIDNCQVNDGLVNILSGTDGYLVQDLFISNSIIGFASNSGILLQNNSGFYFDKIDIISCTGSGLSTYPAAGKSVTAGFLNNVLCDTVSGGNGFFISTNGGNTADINFVNCWGSTCGLNGTFVDGGAGVVSNISFVNQRNVNNQHHGMIIQGTSAHTKKITLTACTMSNNSQAGLGGYHGLAIGADTSYWSVIGGNYGDGSVSLGTNNQAYGIFVAAGTGDYFQIIGVLTTGNQTAGILNGASGTHIVIDTAEYPQLGGGAVSSYNTRTGAVTGVWADIIGMFALAVTWLDLGKTFRITGLQAPAAGEGLELAYDTVAHLGYIICYDRSGTAFKSLNMQAAAYDISVAAGSAIQIATTKIVNFPVSPTVPTLGSSDSSTKVANSSFVQAAIAAAMGSFASVAYVDARTPQWSRGLTNVSTNGSGQWQVAHGLGSTPAAALISPAAVSGNVQIVQYSIDATNIYGYAYTAAGVLLASSSFYVNFAVCT
jgi:hypothetical protein